MFNSSSDSKPPIYQEVPGDEDHRLLPRRRSTNIVQYACIAFLALAWAITLGLYWRLDHNSLRIPRSPIPNEIYKPVRKIFQPDQRYIGPSIETNHHWDDLVAGHDAVWIPDASNWGLPTGIVPPFNHPHKANPPPTTFYVVSILHQLHCLNILRYQYWQAVQTAQSSDPDKAKWALHVDHCFEYLRLAISCGGDLTIEGASPLAAAGEQGHATSVSGWGVEHECINFEALRSWAVGTEEGYNRTWNGEGEKREGGEGTSRGNSIYINSST